MISVIVPVYRVEAYLARCIESICRQTYRDLEIILVDDGSPDSCGQICDSYAGKDPRILVIHKENGGLSDARNAGMELAHGDWICFIDSDDFIAGNMLEALYRRCVKDRSDMAVCDLVCVDEHGAGLPEMNEDIMVWDEILTSKQALDKLCGYKYWYYVMMQNKLYRRELFSDIRFPKGKQHEDEFVTYRLFAKCRRISCVKGGLYYYTQRSDSIMGRPYSVRRLDSVEANIEQVEFFMNTGRKMYAIHAMKRADCLLKIGLEHLDRSLPENHDRICQLEQRLLALPQEEGISVFLRIRYRLYRKRKRLLSKVKAQLRQRQENRRRKGILWRFQK